MSGVGELRVGTVVRLKDGRVMRVTGFSEYRWGPVYRIGLVELENVEGRAAVRYEQIESKVYAG